MIIKAPQLQRALSAPALTRLLLLHGPEESASRALVARIAAALGEGAERIDLAAAEVKVDPARLADEAATFSMFAGTRYIVVERATDDILPAVEGLLDANIVGNPVVLLAGELRKSSKLLKRVGDDPVAVAFASYPAEGRDAAPLVTDMAHAQGLAVGRDVAVRIATACGGVRGAIEQELAKYALYLDASPGAPKSLDHDAVDAIGAGTGEGDLSRLVDSVAGGDPAALAAEIARLRAEGQEGITLTRAVLRRMALLARLRAQVERGGSVSGVMASSGKSLFWKEKKSVEPQLGKWRSELIAKAVSRLIEAERQVMLPGGPGIIAADAELFAICRQAARPR